MNAPLPPPLKTDAGQDELRRRTRRLSQRHRTVLLLVDGRRSCEDVLTLADKAGVAASYFDELVAMGLVELPVAPGAEGEAVSPAAGEPAQVLAAALQPRTEAEAPLAAAPALPDRPAPLEREGHEAAAAEATPLATVDDVPSAAGPLLTSLPPPSVSLLWQAESSQAPLSTASMPLQDLASTPPLARARPARVKFASPKYEPPAPKPRPVVRVRKPPVAAPAPRPAPSARAPGRAEPGRSVSEEALLSEVRGLLIGTLLVDGPVTSSLLALRVGRARQRAELVTLVWEIERTLVRARLPREALGRLRKARDLLGLGNTLVQEDTEPGPASE